MPQIPTICGPIFDNFIFRREEEGLLEKHARDFDLSSLKKLSCFAAIASGCCKTGRSSTGWDGVQDNHVHDLWLQFRAQKKPNKKKK